MAELEREIADPSEWERALLIAADTITGQRAVVVRVSDPGLGSSGNWWGCYLGSDTRETTFQWDGVLYHYNSFGLVPGETSYAKSSDLFMDCDIMVKD